MSGSAKGALFDAFASVAQALGSGRRAEIVDVLAQGERSVEEIATEIEQSLANTSHHLQLLSRAGFTVRKRGDFTDGRPLRIGFAVQSALLWALLWLATTRLLTDRWERLAHRAAEFPPASEKIPSTLVVH